MELDLLFVCLALMAALSLVGLLLCTFDSAMIMDLLMVNLKSEEEWSDGSQ